MSTRNPSNADAWSDYWASGEDHSCAGSFEGNYEGVIGAFWRTVVGQMTSDHRVLDIATGNGPLPRLIQQQQATRAPRVDAVDQASIRPAWFDPGSMPTIHFHPRVDATSLPFPDRSFDWGVSQFGFEYVPRPQGIEELARVMKPGGQIALVLHHQDSVIARVGWTETAQYDLLLSPGGLLDTAAGLLPHLLAATGRHGAPDARRAEACRAAYNRVMADLSLRIDSSMGESGLLDDVRGSVHGLVAMSPRWGLERSLNALDAYRKRLVLGKLRLQEMLASRLSAAEVDSIAQALARAAGGGEASVRTLEQGEGIMAWAVELRLAY